MIWSARWRALDVALAMGIAKVDFSLAFMWGDSGISLPRSVGGPHDDGKVYG